MLALATTTITIFRGSTAEDVKGDTDDTGTPVYSGVPASLIERTRYVATADNTTPLMVRYVVGRVGSEVDIQAGDRIQDERSGDYFAVDSISNPQNANVNMDIKLELKKVD